MAIPKPPLFRWRVQYQEPDRDAAIAASVATVNTEEAVTVQAFGEEADINVMMRRFGVTGQLATRAGTPMYGDFTSAPDFRAALDLVNDAREQFLSLPPLVRERFKNDPAELLGFVSNEKNFDEAVRLGLVPAKAPVPAKPSSSAGSPVAKAAEGDPE